MFLTILSGCSEDVDSTSEYTVEQSCVVPPVVESEGPQPIFTNSPITNATELSAGIIFDTSQRLTGSVPAPGAVGALNFTNLTITDKSVQTIFVNGAVPAGKRIGAIFVELSGVGEYFAVPIPVGGSTGSVSGLPVEITLRGPFPIEGTDPEPDLIQNQIISNLTIGAFLVDEAADAPDVTTSFDGINDGNNWLVPAAVPTITAENVGTGAMQYTLFWNTNNTDIDLWLIEPDGNKIFFDATNSVAGDGFLDFDNTSGFGPENIFFNTSIPTGIYKSQVHYFGGSGDATNWSVSITACGSTRAFSGTLGEVDEVDDVLTFEFGPDCTLEELPPEPQTPNVFEEAVVCDLPSQGQ